MIAVPYPVLVKCQFFLPFPWLIYPKKLNHQPTSQPIHFKNFLQHFKHITDKIRREILCQNLNQYYIPVFEKIMSGCKCEWIPSFISHIVKCRHFRYDVQNIQSIRFNAIFISSDEMSLFMWHDSSNNSWDWNQMHPFLFLFTKNISA